MNEPLEQMAIDRSYKVRPCKSAERFMIVDALRMLHSFCKLEQYRYIGFGALEYIDFQIFHEELGIKKMTSIEKKAYDENQKRRFEFNRPYKSIDLLAGSSWEVLPGMNLESNCIVWLDYTDEMRKDMISDMDTLSDRLSKGSVIIMTLNCHPDPISDHEHDKQKRFKKEKRKLKYAIGKNEMPNLENADFGGWGKSKIYCKVLNQQIGRLVEEEYERDVAPYQIFNFRYRSGTGSGGARMMTVGWLLGGDDLPTQRVLSALEQFPFYRDDDNAFTIEVPVLTNKEKSYYKERIPDTGGILPAWADRSDFESFKNIYRYHTTFVAAGQL